MANQPLINGVVTVTALDINGNNVAKQFNAVKAVNFDYSLGKVNVVDATGSFFFPLGPMTSIVCTIVTGVNGSHTVVMS